MNIKQFLQNSVLPKNEARLLLQHITQLTHAQLLTHDEQILSPKQLATLQELETRRAAGEPMAYLLGYREFYGRRFRTTPATLIPRPETEHLVEAVLSKMPSAARVWDLGTGSGAIAITLACERADAQIFASDISENALAVAQQNAADLGAKVSFHRGSWFDVQAKIAADASFDIIVS
ncbi:MAG: peptide chain release factor N(5)-glutamine methyltransferase, partial [Neisseria sp.]|nr:peptide chain release factor N(5)-glutamine methyltransferase [Neisseria sp.]